MRGVAKTAVETLNKPNRLLPPTKRVLRTPVTLHAALQLPHHGGKETTAFFPLETPWPTRRQFSNKLR